MTPLDKAMSHLDCHFTLASNFVTVVGCLFLNISLLNATTIYDAITIILVTDDTLLHMCEQIYMSQNWVFYTERWNFVFAHVILVVLWRRI